MPEDVPREPLPDDYTVEEYLNTTNPYTDNMDIQGALDEVDDPEGDNPFYVFIFGDEEERSVGRWWAGPLDWTSWVILQLERGDESLVANYGIDIRILGFGEWDSNDNSDSMYNLWTELEAEKNYSLRTWYDGEWWSNYVDAIIGITSQSTPADDPPLAGLAPGSEYLDRGRTVMLLKWQVYWMDDNLVQHETSHFYYADDGCPNCCVMAPHTHWQIIILEDGCFWWVNWDILCAYTAYSWCTQCGQIMQEHMNRYPTLSLTISFSADGTTEPPPGTYYFGYGSTATCTTIPNSWRFFKFWSIEGETSDQNPIVVTMDSDHTLEAHFDIPPNSPICPSGRQTGYVGISYSYSTVSSDPDSDLRYRFDWGDDEYRITDWYASEITAYGSHKWDSFGMFDISVRAQDVYMGEEWTMWWQHLDVAIYGMGDCDPSHDGKVNIMDVTAVAICFGSGVPPAPIDVDIIPDNVIDIFDIVRIALVFGDSYSYPQGFWAPPDSSESELLDGQTASVFLNPSSITVTKGQTFNVNVTLADVADLYGWEFQLYWNNTVLNLTSTQVATPECWGEDTFELGSGIENGFNATHGRYWKAMSALNPAPSYNGSLTLATLTFEALNTGTTQLHLQGVELANAEVSPIDHDNVDGAVTVTPKTLYMRSDQHMINNATMYKLMETHTQTANSTSKSTSDPENEATCYWGIRVWKRSANGTEVELTAGSPVAVVSRSTTGQGLQIATWSCPSTSLNPTDSLIVRVYYKFNFQSYSLSSQFTTVQLNATSLEGQTWTIYYYTSRTHNSQQHKTYMYYKWDNTYLSKIENLDYD